MWVFFIDISLCKTSVGLIAGKAQCLHWVAVSLEHISFLHRGGQPALNPQLGSLLSWVALDRGLCTKVPGDSLEGLD